MTNAQRSSRNRRQTNELVVIMWRDIPAQVTARLQGKTASVELPTRFRTAIDKAAMKANKKSFDEYVAEWRRITTPLPNSDHPDPAAAAQTAANAEAKRIAAEYQRERMARLIANEGHESQDNQQEKT